MEISIAALLCMQVLNILGIAVHQKILIRSSVTAFFF